MVDIELGQGVSAFSPSAMAAKKCCPDTNHDVSHVVAASVCSVAQKAGPFEKKVAETRVSAYPGSRASRFSRFRRSSASASKGPSVH